MVTIGIALGLVLGFVFEQLTAVAAGGLVVPGYLALYVTDLPRLGVTIGIALGAYGAVRLLEKRLILYGRRRAILVILVAFAIDWAVLSSLTHVAPDETDSLAAIGHIVPGLIATAMVRSGPVVTLLSTGIVAIVVRLALQLLVPGGLTIA